MLFYLNFRGKEYKVQVESRNETLQLRFNDEAERPIDLFFYGNDCTFIHDSRVFQANIVGMKHEYTVWRPEGNINLSVESEYRRIVGLLRGQAAESENSIHAKMPGKIIKVLVKPGQSVEKDQPVLVMEAMKMENEIRAMTAGEVSKLLVSEGQAVESGALLMEIQPAE